MKFLRYIFLTPIRETQNGFFEWLNLHELPKTTEIQGVQIYSYICLQLALSVNKTK